MIPKWIEIVAKDNRVDVVGLLDKHLTDNYLSGSSPEKKAVKLALSGDAKGAAEVIIEDALHTRIRRPRYGYLLRALGVNGKPSEVSTWRGLNPDELNLGEFSNALIERCYEKRNSG